MNRGHWCRTVPKRQAHGVRFVATPSQPPKDYKVPVNNKTHDLIKLIRGIKFQEPIYPLNKPCVKPIKGVKGFNGRFE
jgi:hypothetical protein